QIRQALSIHDEIVHISVEINILKSAYVPRETLA
ncbi:cation transporter, partial [Acinetobacter oleivorans]|nr:cation transporter [Acinetobacter oleivorans]